MKFRIIDRPWMASYRYVLECKHFLGPWKCIETYTDLERAKAQAHALTNPRVVWP